MTLRDDATWIGPDQQIGLAIEANGPADAPRRLRLVLVRGDVLEPLGELSAASAMELAGVFLLAAQHLDQAYCVRALGEISSRLDAWRQLEEGPAGPRH